MRPHDPLATQARPPGRPEPVEFGFPVLRATMLLPDATTLDEARDAAAHLGPCYLSLSDSTRAGGRRDGKPTATSARHFVEDAESLEPPPEPSARALWDDEDPLLSRVTALADPDDDSEHLVVRVLDRDENTLLGGAVLSGRTIAKRLLQSNDAVDFEADILLHGVLKGFLRGSAKMAQKPPPQTPSNDPPQALPPPAPETATPKGKSVTKSVAKGIGNMLGLRHKKK